MLRGTKDLFRYRIHAVDGVIGHVHDLLFDDSSGAIRYLVVGTGRWLAGRTVLVASSALGSPDRELREIPVQLTIDQIRQSPPLDADRPVSRQYEVWLHEHYTWRPYWRRKKANPEGTPPPPVEDPHERRAPGDRHLRSCREIIGYYIEASDGPMGHVEDFIVDKDAWILRYVEVDTRNFFGGKKVLVAFPWIADFRYPVSTVVLDVTRDEIRRGPAYHPECLNDRSWETELHAHFRRPVYWTQA